MKTPLFWYDPSIKAPWYLTPLEKLYAVGQRIHSQLRGEPQPVSVSVICVGNLVAGGAGKTPVVRALQRSLKAKGFNPHVVTRGYGGSLKGPIPVDPSHHDYKAVGDEALLLSRMGPTWVSKDRLSGIQAACSNGATHILLDDGLQSQSVLNMFNILVVDGRMGFGNGHLLPRGPLREPLKSGLSKAHHVICMGEDTWGVEACIQQYIPKIPFTKATLRPINPKPGPIVAFAGIGFPEKFFLSLERVGYTLEKRYSFPDHHPYSERDLDPFQQETLPILTTEKDWVRLPSRWQNKIKYLEVECLEVESLGIDFLA